MSIYESHMKLDTVYQLQCMNDIMREQIQTYDIASLAILGVAGGNGLEHVNLNKHHKIYGIDINTEYLNSCKSRYYDMRDKLTLLSRDLLDLAIDLPKAELVIANLFLEYIGLDRFIFQLKKMSPEYVSVVIQVNDGEGFVSESPYHNAFDCLASVYHEINSKALTDAMNEIDFALILDVETELPNKKKLKRQDYKKQNKADA
ncbi:class I SAM-dependent methyltransferase [Anaerocolumna sp. AGMB13020]|uniref:class I SAM-dependent methyltransferase n=1 Tax=Anaerocolumna sp. AGMB13020 TaxID=3081750 RepID=UPI002955A2BB|nr:class I SAM-dependent methyltransferase [Anaerocolumna sp. AGMB13020]WOO34716.1 class I SAM-dependent methyltransferase [Anaerocolumna sp. AGMB13020]